VPEQKMFRDRTEAMLFWPEQYQYPFQYNLYAWSYTGSFWTWYLTNHLWTCHSIYGLVAVGTKMNWSDSEQWRCYTRARQVRWPGWKIHRPGSALPIALLCFRNSVNRK